MCPTICTRLLEDELRFQACHSVRTRPGGNTRPERCVEDGQPGQKRFSQAVPSLCKGRAEKDRSQIITSTFSASQPPRHNNRTHDPHDRMGLVRDMTLFKVAFSTTKREDRLIHTLLQHISRLPDKCGFLFHFQWEKTMRDGADHLMTVEYDTKRMTTCMYHKSS